jgi:hypothetical protein
MRAFVRSATALIVGTVAANSGGCGNSATPIRGMGPGAGRTISLNQMYSTNDQPGTRRATILLDETIRKSPAPRIFVVAAANVEQATEEVVSQLHGAPCHAAPPSVRMSWLVVYFGTSGSWPPPWTLCPVSVRGRLIVAPYRELDGPPFSTDLVPFVFLIPLGDLAPGTYVLRLYDSRAGRNTIEVEQAMPLTCAPHAVGTDPSSSAQR